VFSGADAFKLYDTYGFPIDLTVEMAEEEGLTVDLDGFHALMQEQRRRARAARAALGELAWAGIDLGLDSTPTAFVGYNEFRAGARVLAIVVGDELRGEVREGEKAVVVLDRTPFYAEMGGQTADQGTIAVGKAIFDVTEVHKNKGDKYLHTGVMRTGTLSVDDTADASIDMDRRKAVMRAHSATHLLQKALRAVLGEHVQQAGSLVEPDRLRFDFTHFSAVTAEELAEIERRVNAEVRANHPVVIREMGMQEAMDAGAIALFGEKYGERVRVVAMGDSVELCGGTHVGRTGEIGLFKLVSEGGVSAGVRRVEALTGQAALDHVAQEERRLRDAAGLLGGTTADVADKLKALLERQKRLEREIELHKAKAASGATADLAQRAVDVDGAKVVAARLEGLDAKALRDAMDRLRQQLGNAVIVLAGVSDGKVALVAGVAGAVMGRVKAGELVGFVAGRIGGKGGGRPDMAQGGGQDGPGLQEALAEVPAWVAGKLSPG